jgi:hypothetical protein
MQIGQASHPPVDAARRRRQGKEISLRGGVQVPGMTDLGLAEARADAGCGGMTGGDGRGRGGDDAAPVAADESGDRGTASEGVVRRRHGEDGEGCGPPWPRASQGRGRGGGRHRRTGWLCGPMMAGVDG